MVKSPVKRSHAHPVDLHVGRRVLERRKELDLTQGDMAQEMGVSFQQFQKYEKGANRISASKLWIAASALSVDVDYFFEGLPGAADFVSAEVPPDPVQTARLGNIGSDVRALSLKQQKLVVALFEVLVQQNESPSGRTSLPSRRRSHESPLPADAMRRS